MNLASYLERSVRENPQQVAIRMDEKEITYEQFDQRARALAAYFRKNGFTKGDKVGIYLANCPDYLILFYAAWMLGGVAVPINYRFRQEELAFVIADAEIKWLALTREDLEKLKDILTEHEHIRLLFAGELEEGNRHTCLSEIYKTSVEQKVSVLPCRDSEDAMLMYTSGTTGKPKGVRQTHRTNSASIEMVVDAWKLTSRDHILATLSMFHVGGLQCTTLPTLFTGGTVTLLSRWSPKNWISQSRELQPTWSGLISTMLIDVVNFFKANPQEQRPMNHYRLCFFGGSPTPSVICEYFEEVVGVNLLEIYGQTELSGLMITYQAGERRIPGSMGKPMAQVVETKIVSADGERLIAPGDEEAGVMYLRGDVVTPGYWKRDELNRERFEDGWLKTGDIVRWDENGYLYYTDRFDDLIITGGENVYPKEVENILAEHPAVAEVAVIGTPHERWVEQVTAIIVPREEANVAIADIEAFCVLHRGLAGYKRPRKVLFVSELPKTGSGKINKSILKQQYRMQQCTNETSGGNIV
ncbi:class I adenylate-forming enzyme family protein [Brevibacillus centrosporus]|uniref:class I adenylate-forming enzyme family protein n=1 Tax=Brevibacillus centrosporus TaxID=54910 RepID=UPI003D1C5175